MNIRATINKLQKALMQHGKGSENMFIPYRCEDCIYGIYNHEDSCYENGCSASDDDECEELFQEDDRT